MFCIVATKKLGGGGELEEVTQTSERVERIGEELPLTTTIYLKEDNASLFANPPCIVQLRGIASTTACEVCMMPEP